MKKNKIFTRRDFGYALPTYCGTLSESLEFYREQK